MDLTLTSPMSLTRIIVTWFLLMLALTGNGVFREFYLDGWFSPRTAEFLGLMSALAVILVVTGIGFRIPRDYPIASLLLIGGFIVLLTVAYEAGFSLLLGGRTWRQVLKAYAFWHGEPWPPVLLLIGLTPVIWRGRG